MKKASPATRRLAHEALNKGEVRKCFAILTDGEIETLKDLKRHTIGLRSEKKKKLFFMRTFK